MNVSRSEVVVIDTMAASALVNARLDSRRADAFGDLVAGRPVIVSFATVTELLFGAVKAQWAIFEHEPLSGTCPLRAAAPP